MLLKARFIAVSGAKPDRVGGRTAYVITRAGEAEFSKWLYAPPRRGPGREDDLGTRALFLCEARPEDALPLVRKWKDAVWLESKVLEQTRAAPPLSAASPGLRGLDILLTRRVSAIAADIELLDAVERRLHQQPASAHAVELIPDQASEPSETDSVPEPAPRARRRSAAGGSR